MDVGQHRFFSIFSIFVGIGLGIKITKLFKRQKNTRLNWKRQIYADDAFYGDGATSVIAMRDIVQHLFYENNQSNITLIRDSGYVG